MPRRIVWHLAGSPAADLLAGLPDAFEIRPLPGATPPPPGPDEGAVLLLDLAAGDTPGAAAAAARRAGVPVVALVPGGAEAALPDCYACLPKAVHPSILARALANACDHAQLSREAADQRRELEELNEIGVRLTAERDTDTLLELILTKAREITHSDAGSIYLVEEPEAGARHLRFKLVQNDSVAVPFSEVTLPLTDRSLAGYVAVTGQMLHLDDVYVLPRGSPFAFNRDFDRQIGYRSKSMLVVPMATPAGEVIGALALLNCKPDPSRRFKSPGEIEAEVVPYPERFRRLAASLASQAAVALENSRLYHSIRMLFEGFVKASVTAIESRDPTTSGHSFRVADLTVALATAADRATDGPFRDVRFSPDQMTEIRYASLLHDFGKVGVREEVLVKAKKLLPGRLELIRQRVELIKRGLELRHVHQKLDRLLARGPQRFAEETAAWDAELTALLAEVDQHMKAVAAANEPTVMPADAASMIHSLPERAFPDHLGEQHAVITAEEARILSIPRGSLTPEEYRQIQSHVVHTYEFLRQIPWTRELRRVPEIARDHHEKLDGSGYPARRPAPEIAIQTRMMTVSDIFDALTARDRPYKSAVPVERALDILGDEARAGALDRALLELFIAVKPWVELGR
ncbi:MAG TPA: HD domain-containing phosphohydrolase [Methylomirabilota bacterium]|nr:HD domain-containing phosphohydrolase [Methylomirabilota bacterium]